MGGHAGPCHSDCFVNWSGPGSLDPASQKCSFFASPFLAYLGGNWEDRKISEICAARGAGNIALCAADPQVRGVDLFGRSRVQRGNELLSSRPLYYWDKWGL